MYETEQEQIEAIKKWWNQYGNWIIGGFLIALISYFSWNYYQSSTQSRLEGASVKYDELLTLVDQGAPSSDRRALIDQLKSDYSRTTYAVYAALLGAADAVSEGNHETALAELDWALSQAADELRPVILVRKARVQYASDELDAAMATLDQISRPGFDVVIYELRGDILTDQGQHDLARSAYETAMARSQEEGISTPFLEMKLNDLATASDS
ncbi:MAG: tetratricopeptide repeat protein [Saccharospirillum sp.]|nr:tetratricopeptide repeat protein [Saccharospirillum sp.]